MKSFVIAAALALGLISGTAEAGRGGDYRTHKPPESGMEQTRRGGWSNQTYKTPRSAALHGAADKLNKSYGWSTWRGRWRAGDMNIAKTPIDKTAPIMKYKAVTKQTHWYGSNKPLHQRTVTIRKDAPAVYRFKR